METIIAIYTIVITTISTIAGVMAVFLQYKQNQNAKSSEPRQLKFPALYRISKLILASFFITFIVMGVRTTGILQGFELSAFDHMMKQRPNETRDQRLLAITISEQDIQSQDNREGGSVSISETNLIRLLNKLETSYQPAIIGLDLYLDWVQNQEIINLLEQKENIFTLCKVRDEEIGIPPPAGVPDGRLGFSDVLLDPDDVVRRHLLSMAPPLQSLCYTPYAFSFQIANSYLKDREVTISATDSGDIKIGDSSLPLINFESGRFGGYQNIDTQGYQIMLNYRSYDNPNKFIERLTLADFLESEISMNLEDRIVLVGVTADSAGDFWDTPYNSGQVNNRMPGVILQAHLISQLLSFGLDDRPLISALPNWPSSSMVWSTCLGWGLLFGFLYDKILRGLLGGCLFGLLYWVCSYTLAQGVWLPFVPSLIGAVLTGVGVVAYRAYNRNSQK